MRTIGVNPRRRGVVVLLSFPLTLMSCGTSAYLEPPPGFPLVSESRAYMAWDNFKRPNGPLGGTRAPSGQRYELTASETHEIRHQRYAPHPRPRIASIAYLNLERRPTTIAAAFAFKGRAASPNAYYGENAVIGTAKTGFGSGSIQLAVWRSQWQLFYVPPPLKGADPSKYCWKTNSDRSVCGTRDERFPVLLAGAFRRQLGVGDVHQMRLRWNAGDSSVTVYAPDSRPRTATSAVINELWGHRFGFQVRRPKAARGDVEFNAVAAI